MRHTERIRYAFSAGLLALIVVASSQALEKESNPKAPLDAAYGKIPLSFEANQGQAEPAVGFLSRGTGYSLLLKSSEAVFALTRSDGAGRACPTATPELHPRRRTAVVRMKFLGADPNASLAGLDEQSNKSNYFIGKDPGKWHAGVPNYARVAARQLYPGIDVVYHGSQRLLEYDLVVAPGARTDSIRIAFEGIERLRLDAAGDLILETRGGELRQERPLVYQEVGGERRLVAAHYVRLGRRKVGFRVEGYDAGEPLVIDPVLSYSSYLGGSGREDGLGIAVDGAGNAYVTGYTASTDFPTSSASQQANGGGLDVYVAKVNATGSALVYSTYLGGSGPDFGRGIALDSSGSAYLTGDTSSVDFPTISPFQLANGGGSDAFVTKIDPAGSALVYSTYLGGSGNDFGYGIAIDSSGSAYVTGSTASTNFPTQNPFQSANKGGGSDAFVTKLDPSGSALVYSSYRGTCTGGFVSPPVCWGETGYGIAVDDQGDAYMMREATNPQADRYCCQSYLRCYKWCYRSRTHTFVEKINAAGSAVLYSRGFAGNGNEYGRGIAVDGSGNAYVTGSTTSTNISTPGSFQPTNPGSRDAFVAKIDTAGSFAYVSYLGGNGSDSGTGIAVDTLGSVYLTGQAFSTNLSIGNPFQPANNSYDAFLARLNAAGSLVYFSYLGGSGSDVGNGIAVDGSGNAYIAGSTGSTDFPTQDPFQAALGGGALDADAFVAKISTASPPPPVSTASFFTLTPCRLLDTRNATGPLGGPALNAGFTRGFTATGRCGIPSSAHALSVNVTITQTDAAGELRFFPVGIPIPATSSISYKADQTRANNAVVQLGTGGDLQVFADQPSGTTQLIIDVNGYFE